MASKFGQGSAELESASAHGAGLLVRSFYFNIEDGETAYVRFITDANPNGHLGGWLNIQQHTSVDTKPKPAWHDANKNWPQRFGVVCRNTICKGLKNEPPLWSVMDDSEYEGCYVCQNLKKKDGKPSAPLPVAGRSAASVRRSSRTTETEAIGTRSGKSRRTAK